MSSSELENRQTSTADTQQPDYSNNFHSVADRLLLLLKTRGPQTSAALGKILGTTSENARQQLTKLAQDGLTQAQPKTQEAQPGTQPTAGRPTLLWHITPKGNARFPDTHAELTVSLLRNLNALGSDLIDRLITMREQETLAHYQQAMSALPSIPNPRTDRDNAHSIIEQRIQTLADMRSREGYMAEWQKLADDQWLLIENHCPICAAATLCQGFCRSELTIFRQILGDGLSIERTEHILHNARRCAYTIKLQTGKLQTGKPHTDKLQTSASTTKSASARKRI